MVSDECYGGENVNNVREELEDVATSVFDLMGRTEETELRISQIIDQLFQVSYDEHSSRFHNHIISILH